METSPTILLAFTVVLMVLYIAYAFRIMERSTNRPRPKHHRCLQAAPRWPEMFEEASPDVPPPTANESAPTPNMQDAMDFSDTFITDSARDQAQRDSQDKQQIQTINDRYRAAKRNVVEFKMKNGVYTNKERRQLVETLLRRPPCGRRIRSWRTENSDFLRGDVRPKSTNMSTNIIRSAKNNPDIDLHPGALGPMAGMQGQWLSEENLPGNIFQDVEGFA